MTKVLQMESWNGGMPTVTFEREGRKDRFLKKRMYTHRYTPIKCKYLPSAESTREVT
jgi:hypothetical protein